MFAHAKRSARHPWQEGTTGVGGYETAGRSEGTAGTRGRSCAGYGGQTRPNETTEGGFDPESSPGSGCDPAVETGITDVHS
jgi:hypothetical protein